MSTTKQTVMGSGKAQSKFDRHEILKKHYSAEIEKQWDFDGIAKDCKANAEYDAENNSRVGYCYLGSHPNIAPSGKYYTFWTTNQNRSDETRDQVFWECFEKALEDHGMFLGDPDSGDGLDVFCGMVIEE